MHAERLPVPNVKCENRAPATHPFTYLNVKPQVCLCPVRVQNEKGRSKNSERCCVGYADSQALENGVSMVGMPSGGGRFPQLSGLRLVYDPALPAGSRVKSAVVSALNQQAAVHCSGHTRRVSLPHPRWLHRALCVGGKGQGACVVCQLFSSCSCPCGVPLPCTVAENRFKVTSAMQHQVPRQ